MTALAVFQYVMDTLLGAQHYNYARAYFDNIVIASKAFDEYVLHVHNVLNAILNGQFSINTKKLIFFTKKLKTLGFILSGELIQLNSDKVKAIQDFPRPQGISDIH
jgi:hypothetical protein